MPAGRADNALRIAVELLFGFCQMHQRNQPKHHALIAVGEILEHFPCLPALLLHVVGENRREIVGVILPSLPVRRVRLNAEHPVLNFAHGLVRGDRQNIDRKHQAAVEAAQLGDHGILEVGCVIPEIQHAPPAPVDAEAVALKFHGVRTKPVLEAVASAHLTAPIEGRRRLALPKKVAEHLQPRREIQLPAHGGQAGKVRQQVGADAREPGARLVHIFLRNADREIALLHHAVVRTGNL